VTNIPGSEWPSYLSGIEVPQPVDTATKPLKQRGWWRRNFIGLIAVLPMLAAMFAFDYKNFYTEFWGNQPHEPITASVNSWVQLDQARMRLVDFAPVPQVKDFLGDPVQLPAGTKVWKAVVEFDVPDSKAVMGCEITLADSTQRLFGAGPRELDKADLPIPSCDPDFDHENAKDYQNTFYFIAPADAKPAAVHITRSTQLPKYVNLTVPTGLSA